MHVAALQRAYGFGVNGPARDRRRHRHVPTAQGLADGDDVRFEAPVLERKHLAGAAQAGLDLVDDEQRAEAAAKRLRFKQVVSGRQRDFATLDGLADERGDVARLEFRLQRVQIAERHQFTAGQQRSKTFLEKLVANHRQRPECDAVEAALARHEIRATGGRPCELHRRIHGFGARARKKRGVEPGRQSRESSSASIPARAE